MLRIGRLFDSLDAVPSQIAALVNILHLHEQPSVPLHTLWALSERVTRANICYLAKGFHPRAYSRAFMRELHLPQVAQHPAQVASWTSSLILQSSSLAHRRVAPAST